MVNEPSVFEPLKFDCKFQYCGYTSILCWCIVNLKTLVLIGAHKPVMENLIEEKEKWTNERNDKCDDAYSILHNSTSYTQCLLQISKSYITKTRLYSFNPLKTLFFTVKLGFTGVDINFLISAQKHRLLVLVRTASPRRF